MSELEVARRRPSMAVLSAMLHGLGGDLEALAVGLRVALDFSDDRRWRYASCLLSILPNTQRDIILGALTMNERHELTEVERNSVAFHDGLLEGKLEGKLEGLRELVLTILELRSLPLDAATVQRVHACEDAERLERWASAARRADDLAAVFDEG